jgi:hypothetical protein
MYFIIKLLVVLVVTLGVYEWLVDLIAAKKQVPKKRNFKTCTIFTAFCGFVLYMTFNTVIFWVSIAAILYGAVFFYKRVMSNNE